jgi:hypothetical protein
MRTCGTIDAPLGKDESSRVAIRDCVRADGADGTDQLRGTAPVQARRDAAFSLLRIEPHTGRKHQIRIHLAHAGHAIVGDKIYGSDEDAYLALVEGRLGPAERAALIFPTHALHARSLRFDLAWREPTSSAANQRSGSANFRRTVADRHQRSRCCSHASALLVYHRSMGHPSNTAPPDPPGNTGIAPAFNLARFTCPSCHELADQVWLSVYAAPISNPAGVPLRIAGADLERLGQNPQFPPQVREQKLAYWNKVNSGTVFLERWAPGTD